MRPINSLSHTSHVNDWLANTHRAHLLHIFDHACNLINEHREVLSIVTPQIGNGPFNLVVEGDILFSEHINIQTLVLIHDHQLILGDLMLNTSNVKLWSPHPNWEILHAKRQEILDQLAQLQITNYLVCGLDTSLAKNAQSCSTTIFKPTSPITNYREASPGDQFCNSLVSTLSVALATADISTAKTIASQLAGLGAGLTPAGDDFMMGAIYAAWIIHPPEVAGVFAKEIASTAAPLTTSLSAAWLRSAGRGEAGILWHEFFDALASVGRIANPTYETAIQESIAKILDVGETSGADALAGFIGSFVYWKEKACISH